MKVVTLDQMPKWPWEPRHTFWGTIHTYDRWVGPACQTWFWMRRHRVKL